MRTFFLLRRPMPRRTVVFCHLLAQVGLLLGGAAWLVQRTPWLAPVTWLEAWPTLLLGAGLLVLAMVAARLLADLLMLPHYVAASLRQGFVPGAIMTRSFDRRPAVHDPQDSWVNDAKAATQPAILDEEAVGNARVIRPRRPFSTRQVPDDENRATSSDKDGEAPGPRQEPSF